MTGTDLIDRLGELDAVALVDRWRTFFQSWRLVRPLSTRSVQGQLLVCEPVDRALTSVPVLLVKLHRRPRDELRHEALVNDDMRDRVVGACPQFMSIAHHGYMPWSWREQDHGRPCLPRYALFFRSAPCRLTMSTLVRRFWYDTPLIMSQATLMLAGLQLAQQLAQFTSYDAHLNNVLVQRTRARWFLYRLPVSYDPEHPVVVLVPTYGHFPFFIDYGRAHSVSVSRAESITYSLQHQSCGIQSAVFDGAYDVHHLMLCLAHAMQGGDGEGVRAVSWGMGRVVRAVSWGMGRVVRAVSWGMVRAVSWGMSGRATARRMRRNIAGHESQ